MNKECILIKNGKIITVAKIGNIENGQVLIIDGKIAEVGKSVATPPNCKVVDAKGGYVMPGLIDAHCHIGIFETASGMEGNDGNEMSDPVTPQLRGIDGINPSDAEFDHAVKHGVTCVATGPGSANPIGGTFVALKTVGKTVDDMIIKNPLAMKIAFGENPKKCYGANGKNPVTRMATAALIREWLYKAKEYAKKKDIAENDMDKMPSFDMKLEALEAVIRKEIPLKAHAHRADDIMTALRIAKEFDVDITLEHCSEGYLIAEELKKHNKGIIIGPLGIFPSKPEVENLSLKSAKVLFDAGLKVAIMSDLPATHVGDLPVIVGRCMKEGLSEANAYRAVTINAAEILGLADRMGTLEKGKDANIAIFSSHPFLDITAKCIGTILEGEIEHRDGI